MAEPTARGREPAQVAGPVPQPKPELELEPSDPFAAADPASNTAMKTLGDVLNPSGQVPQGQFKAFYFNSQRPSHVIGSATVAEVGIKYSWAEFRGIPSEDFGAYWVGRFHAPKSTRRIISVSQSWSQTRIIIDKVVVYEGGSDAQVPYTISAGDHLIEVEFENNWHTTDLKVDFKGQTQQAEPEVLGQGAAAGVAPRSSAVSALARTGSHRRLLPAAGSEKAASTWAA